MKQVLELDYVKSRLERIGQDLIDLSKMDNQTANVKTEMVCALGAYIKCLQLQIKILEENETSNS